MLGKVLLLFGVDVRSWLGHVPIARDVVFYCIRGALFFFSFIVCFGR